jgi:two-component system, OmpR family, sensor kinase
VASTPTTVLAVAADVKPWGRGSGWRWGTAARLSTFVGLILVVVLGLSLLGLLRAFSAQSDAATNRSLVVELRAFAAAASTRPAGQDLATFAGSYLRTRILDAGEVVAVILPDGTVVASAGSQGVLDTPTVRGWRTRPLQHGVQRHLTAQGHGYLVNATPLVVRGVRSATVVAATDTRQTGKDVGRVRALAIGEGLIALLAAMGGCYLMLRRLLRRVARITTTAADIGAGALDRRLGEQASDEVGHLAATFDAMADRLAAAMTGQRRLLSDVSHQLRTPLTVARGHLEVLQRSGSADPVEVRETVDLVVDEIDHMKALVEQLLMLGRAMEPDFLAVEPVDVRSFCADLVDAAHVLARRRWVHPTAPDIVVAVDAAKLRGALLNLIDNAVRATGDSDTVAVVVRRLADGGLGFAVEDSGPGIPAERRQQVLERFARPGAADTEGTGLGLAIASAVARAHGGDLTIGESEYGGCAVTLVLPPSVVVVSEIVEPEGAPCAS